MQKIQLLLYTCFFIQTALYGQDSLTFIKTLALKAKSIETDNAGNFYTLLGKNTIVKYTNNGDSLYTYKSERKLGKLTYISTTNPLTILAFYSDFQEVILLDRSLSIIGGFHLRTLGLNEIKHLCVSSDNHIWLYDPNDFSLKKVNARGQIMQKGQNIAHQIDQDFEVKKLVGNENELFLWIELSKSHQRKLLLFDNIGNFKEQIDFPADDLFLQNNTIFSYDKTKGLVTAYQDKTGGSVLPVKFLEDKDFQELRIAGNRIFIRNTKTIAIYKF